MAYTINPKAYSDMFFLPASVADDYIKLAGVTQIKTLIFLCRHINEKVSAEDIAEAIGKSADDVSDALDFWSELGIINSEETIEPLLKEEKKKKAEKTEKKAETEDMASVESPTKKKVEAIYLNPPTHAEVAQRCLQSQDLREILSTTEQRIGNTLSFSMQATLVMLYDDYGLPAGVIALLVEYAVGRKKATSRYIANLGRIWCENEIDTIDKAMAYIEGQSAAEDFWREFREATGVKNPSPTMKQKQYINTWLNDMQFSHAMIILAYEEMAENTGTFSFPYMNKILENWAKAGIKTKAAALKAKEERKQPKKTEKPKKENKTSASYDIGAYTKKAFSNPMNTLKEEGN